MPSPLAESLAALETASIAVGWKVLDAVTKRALVRLLDSRPVSPGKFLLLFAGEVANVAESFEAGVEASGGPPELVGSLRLAHVHPDVVSAMTCRRQAPVGEAVGIVETATVAAAIGAADTVVKTAEVTLVSLAMAQGLGGKGYFLFTGTLADVEAGIEAGAAAVDPNLLVATRIISAPTEEWLAAFARAGGA